MHDMGRAGISLKYVSTASTVAQLLTIIIQFRLALRLEKSRTMTLVAGRSNTSPSAAGGLWEHTTPGALIKLGLELLLSAVHSPPGLEKDIRVEALGNVCYYRAESVLSVLTCVRLYHVWRWINMRVQYSFCNLEVKWWSLRQRGAQAGGLATS